MFCPLLVNASIKKVEIINKCFINVLYKSIYTCIKKQKNELSNNGINFKMV